MKDDPNLSPLHTSCMVERLLDCHMSTTPRTPRTQIMEINHNEMSQDSGPPPEELSVMTAT